MKRINFCMECRNLWVDWANRFTILRIDPGDKLKIIGNKCFICKFKIGEFDYKKFLSFLEYYFDLEYKKDHLTKIVFKEDKRYLHYIPDKIYNDNNNLYDFSNRMDKFLNFIRTIQNTYFVIGESLESKLFNILF